MNQRDQGKVLAQLREAYDGSYSRRVGTGTEVIWKGKLTMILACTGAIDSVAGRELHQSLGERFLDYRIELPDRQDMTGAALEGSGNEEYMRRYRLETARDFIVARRRTGQGLEIPAEVKESLTPLADFVALARSTVARDRYTREIISDTAEADAEQGTRLVKELYRLAQSMLQVSPDIPLLPVVRKIAIDSIPRPRSSILRLLMAATEPTPTPEIAAALRIPATTAERALEDLHALGLVERKRGARNVLYWNLSPRAPRWT